MKKIALALTAASICGLSATAQAAKVDVCVFDLLGKSGESYKMMEEWALAAKGRAPISIWCHVRMKPLQTTISKPANVMPWP